MAANGSVERQCRPGLAAWGVRREETLHAVGAEVALPLIAAHRVDLRVGVEVPHSLQRARS